MALMSASVKAPWLSLAVAEVQHTGKVIGLVRMVLSQSVVAKESAIQTEVQVVELVAAMGKMEKTPRFQTQVLGG
jgi:hypothetical protein